MRKTILATAIAAVSLGGFTTANAAETPTVYGEVNLSTEYVDNAVDTDGSVDSDTTLKSRDSFVGFKGSESLENGFDVVYDAQVGFEYDSQDSDSDFELRKGMLGLESGSWGVSAGRIDNPYVGLTKQGDMFDNTLAETSTVFASDVFERTDKSIGAHVTPTDGLTIKALAALDADEEIDTTGTDFTFDAYALTAQYDLEFMSVFGGYQDVDFEDDATSDQYSYKIGAGFKPSELTMVSIAGEHTEYDLNDGDRDTVSLQGAYAISSKVTLKASYGYLGELESNAGTVAESGSVYALGADYKIGQNTTVNATVAHRDEDTGVSFAGYADTYAAASDNTGVSVGISHRF